MVKSGPPFGDSDPASSAIRRIRAAVSNVETRIASGYLLGVTGTLIQAYLPGARVGELCELRTSETGDRRYAEVIGLDGDKVLLAPYGALSGLSVKTEVVGLGRSPDLMVGDHLLGTVVDAFGQAIPEYTPAQTNLRHNMASGELRELNAPAPSSGARRMIEHPFEVGIRCIDGFITMGEGQRVGIYGSAGAGKSTLLGSIIANAKADVFVITLIGERGREVGEMVKRTLTPERRSKAVVVVSTSDRPPVERVQASLVATSIAEYFRDQGKRVLLLFDSVTRLARAVRHVGLSAGEPPTRRGFTPSVFSTLPKLFERAGMGATGSITAIYTVLVEGEASADPVAEETRSLLDGHIVLSDKLARGGHYPAIDILESRSRVMEHIVSKEHSAAANHLRALVARYKEIELLIQVGEYKMGNDPLSDEAVQKIHQINAFLKQKGDEVSTFAQTLRSMIELTK